MDKRKPCEPLSHLKVLDFTTLLPGPWATLQLADLGADVLRIESNSRPDPIRFMPPKNSAGKSAHFNYLNRNKRSLGLNLKQSDAVSIIKRLVHQYDIIIEQFRPGVMQRLGLGFEVLQQENSRIIYCSLTGYGQYGPLAQRAGHDLNYLARSGVLSYQGNENTGPMALAIQLADVAGGGCHSVMSILAAVIQRQITGQGQYIDVSMMDTAFNLQPLQLTPALLEQQNPLLGKTLLGGGTFYDVYETQDNEYLTVGCLEPKFFERFVTALGFPELVQHVNTLGMDPNHPQAKQLKQHINDQIKLKTLAEWQNIFDEIDCCVEPVLTLVDALAQPQVQARELIVYVSNSNHQQPQLAFPVKFNKWQLSYHPAPKLGEHTEEVLQNSGYSDKDIKLWLERGVVFRA